MGSYPAGPIGRRDYALIPAASDPLNVDQPAGAIRRMLLFAPSAIT
jgi:hypothetical protein